MLEGIPGQPGRTEAAPREAEHPGRVREAAEQFEALLVAQMLRGVREADSSGWLGTGDDEASESAVGLAEEQFARALSRSGGLGLTDLIVSGLDRGEEAYRLQARVPPSPAVSEKKRAAGAE